MNADRFYVVENGLFDVLIDGVGKVAEKGEASSFGELALLNDAPRAATIKVSLSFGLCGITEDGLFCFTHDGVGIVFDL